jgi:hypothetical protein
MMELQFTDISRVIQQVLAPAFLLTSIGTLLTVLTQRLARVIDRAREVSFETETPDETADLAALRDMLAIRAKLIQRGIVLYGGRETVAFTEQLWAVPLSWWWGKDTLSV